MDFSIHMAVSLSHASVATRAIQTWAEVGIRKSNFEEEIMFRSNHI